MDSSHVKVLVVITVAVFLLLSCSSEKSIDSGFTISLIESGEVILSDEHIDSYVWDTHHIILSAEGIERWESFAKYDKSQTPPVRKLGELTNKEFIVTVKGVEMYRGYFSSMLSSYAKLGVVLFDTCGTKDGELWVSFRRLNGDSKGDPRTSPEIEAYFRKHGKFQ